jgi:hypothetical protein
LLHNLRSVRFARSHTQQRDNTQQPSTYSSHFTLSLTQIWRVESQWPKYKASDTSPHPSVEHIFVIIHHVLYVSHHIEPHVHAREGCSIYSLYSLLVVALV